MEKPRSKDNQELLLKVMASHGEGDMLFEREELLSFTGLKPQQLNDAVVLAREAGWVRVEGKANVKPFTFDKASLTEKGRAQAEESALPKPNPFASFLKEQLTPRKIAEKLFWALILPAVTWFAARLGGLKMTDEVVVWGLTFFVICAIGAWLGGVKFNTKGRFLFATSIFLVVLVAAGFLTMKEAASKPVPATQPEMPDIRIVINRLSLGDMGADRVGTSLTFWLRVANRGSQTMLDSWRLAVQIDGQSGAINAPLQKVPSPFRLFIGEDEKQLMTLSADDDLSEKTVKEPLVKGGLIHGLLWFFLPNVDKAVIKARKTHLTVFCEDAYGKRYSAGQLLGALNSTAIVHFPGMKVPVVEPNPEMKTSSRIPKK